MTTAVKSTGKMVREGRKNPLRITLAAIGRATIGLLRPPVRLSAMAVAVVLQACRPLNWRRTIAGEFMRQGRLIGVGALPFTLVSGLLIGLAMIYQLVYWLNVAGQNELAGKIIVLSMVREVAPFIVALIVIGRSGSVNMVEFGSMNADGQLRMLDAQGIDIFLFLVMPRCLAAALSMFCLTIIFLLTALMVGFTVGSVTQFTGDTAAEFFNRVLAAMGAGEYAIIILKPTVIGVLITLITCTTGIRVDGRTRQVAQVLPQGFVKSVLALFVVTGGLSLLL